MNKLIFMVYFCCISIAAIGEPSPPKCINQKPAQPFSGVIPPNFILVPTCKGASIASEYDSRYIFLGDATISGSIRYEDTETFGHYASFFADQQSEKLLPTNISLFKLNGEGSPNVQNIFNPPKLTSKIKCWEAPAKIRIKHINVNIDAGTDVEGNYLIDYTVLSVGKYEHCKL